MKPYFSIIIPIYNAEMYLEYCLNSIISCQNFRNFELIIVDDGSDDGSLNIVKDYEFDKLILIKNEINQGLSFSRNVGLSKANGEYIIFIDADDFISDGALLKLKAMTEINNADIVITKIEGFAEKGVCRSYTAPKLDINYINDLSYQDVFIELIKCGVGLGPSVRYIFKRDIIARNGLKFKNTYDEDQMWSTELVSCCKSVHIYYDSYYHYRLRSDSLSTNVSSSRALSLLDTSINIYKLKDKYPQMKRFILKRSKYMYNKAIDLI